MDLGNRKRSSRGTLVQFADLESRVMLTVAPVPLIFQDVSVEANLTTPLLGMMLHAAAWGDVDGDDDLDLFVGTFSDRPAADYNVRGNTNGPSPNRLLLNNGDGTFSESVQPPLNIRGRTSGATFADFDNDGDLDLIVITNSVVGTGAPKAERSHLYRNDGTGQFTDVTAGSNIDFPVPFTGRNAFVLDYDNDGLLDVLIQEDTWFGTGNASHLMRNTGNFVFQDVTAAAGLPTNMVGLGGAVGDVNGDGYVDLFLANATYSSLTNPKYTFQNNVYLNNGNGTFRDSGASAVLNVRGPNDWPIPSSGDNEPAGGALGDLNGDGRLDLVIGHHYNATYTGLMRMSVRVYLNTGNDPSGNPVFQDITAASGIVPIYIKTPHVEIQDFDNDGRMDILTSAEMKVGGVFQPFIYQNLGTVGGVPQFAIPAGTGDPAVYNGYDPADGDTYDPRYFAAAPTADFNNDGLLDIFGEEWWPDQAPPLFQNVTASSHHWLDVRIDRGTGAANRFGIGSTIRIYQAGQAGNPAALLGVKSLSISDGYVSGQAAIAHFGLGDQTTVDVQVLLSGGQVLTRTGVDSDRTVTVTSLTLDIDGNGTASALTDGILAFRFLFGMRGAELINGAVAPGAPRDTAAEIQGYLEEAGMILDVDGNGSQAALTDGILIFRYLFGMRGAELINGAVAPGAPRDTAAEIESYLQGYMPSSPALDATALSGAAPITGASRSPKALLSSLAAGPESGPQGQRKQPRLQRDAKADGLLSDLGLEDENEERRRVLAE